MKVALILLSEKNTLGVLCLEYGGSVDEVKGTPQTGTSNEHDS